MNIERIKIADRVIETVVDDEGIRWYPIERFFKVMLIKYSIKAKLRDSNFRKHMTVFNVRLTGMRCSKDTWFMDEEGMKLLLPQITVSEKGDPDLVKLRSKLLTNACLYFGLRPKQGVNRTYTSITPDMSERKRGYQPWQRMCLLQDPKVNLYHNWKICRNCNRYFPDNAMYFEMRDDGISSPFCLTCAGKSPYCVNPVMQAIHEAGGDDILEKIHNHDCNPEKMMDELYEFIFIRNRQF